MAANISQRRVRTSILASPVRDFATWSLLVTCARCDLARTVPMAELPPDLPIMQALLRMRCRTCLGRVEAAALPVVFAWRDLARPGRFVPAHGIGDRMAVLAASVLGRV